MPGTTTLLTATSNGHGMMRCIPSLEGLQPTVRIYASDYAWCSLDSDSSNDLRQFLEYLDELEEKYLALHRLEKPGRRWTLDEIEQGWDKV